MDKEQLREASLAFSDLLRERLTADRREFLERLGVSGDEERSQPEQENED